MSDLISRSEEIKMIDLNCRNEEEFQFFKELIEAVPTVDAVSVVHASWEDCGWVELDEHGGFTAYPHEGMRCSNCNRAFKKELLWTDNFCPNCGAKMDGKKVQE